MKVNEAEEQNSIARIESFDTMRAVACLAIVLLHVISTWRDDPVHGSTYYPHLIAKVFIYHNIVSVFGNKPIIWNTFQVAV